MLEIVLPGSLTGFSSVSAAADVMDWFITIFVSGVLPTLLLR